MFLAAKEKKKRVDFIFVIFLQVGLCWQPKTNVIILKVYSLNNWRSESLDNICYKVFELETNCTTQLIKCFTLVLL